MLANLSITSKSNQLQEKSAGAFIFEETKETKFLTHCSQKKNQKKNRMTLSQVVLKLMFLMRRKDPGE